MATMGKIFLCAMYGVCLMALSEAFTGACEAHDPSTALFMVVLAFLPPAAIIWIGWPNRKWRRKVTNAFLTLPAEERLAIHRAWGDAQYSPKMLTEPPKEWLEPGSIDLENWLETRKILRSAAF